MTFSEKDLKRAAQAVDRSMLDALPPPESPSPQLMTKLEQLSVGKKSRKRWKTVLSRAAACLLMFFIVGAGWLSFDVEARKALLFWFRDFTDDRYIYQFVEAESHETLPEYAFAWLPAGWELTHQDEDDPNFDRFGFRYDNDTHFSLTYFYPKADTRYVLVSPYAGIRVSHSTVSIHGSQADYYQISGNRTERRLIWMDESSGILFQLAGDLPEDADLIKMMESLQLVETNR